MTSWCQQQQQGISDDWVSTGREEREQEAKRDMEK